ncbi:MAG: Gx transporter family protein [Bacillota bacterium]
MSAVGAGRISTKRMVELALLAGMAIAVHAVEDRIPVPLSLPGAKLGLANAMALAALSCFSFRDALIVNLVRTFLGSLIAGTFLTFAFFLSFSGAVASTVVMWTVMRLQLGLGMAGVSVCGAVTHNLTQLAAAIAITQEPHLLAYLPYLLLYAVPAGVFNGLVAEKLGLALKESGRGIGGGKNPKRSDKATCSLPENTEQYRA